MSLYKHRIARLLCYVHLSQKLTPEATEAVLKFKKTQDGALGLPGAYRAQLGAVASAPLWATLVHGLSVQVLSQNVIGGGVLFLSVYNRRIPHLFCYGQHCV